MRLGPRLRQRLADESGAIMLLMAISVPVIVLLLAMSLDIGNWYVHKRQLENRVKAGALAAGVAYGADFAECTDSTKTQAERDAAENRIRDVALQYAGGAVGGFNTTPGDAGNQLTIAINGNVAGQGPCFLHAPGGGFPSNDGGYWADVAADAAEVPSFFSGFGVPKPKIVASARVALMRPSGGMQPFAVSDPSATSCVTALFRDAGDDSLIAAVPLDPGAGNSWTEQAPSWPAVGDNNMTVSVRVGCPPNARTYTDMAYVTRVPPTTASPPPLTSLELTPLNGCANSNPYFIPYDSPDPCQMTLTVVFAAAVADARVTVGASAAQGLSCTSGLPPCATWAGPVTRAAGSGTDANGSELITIEAMAGAGDPWLFKGRAKIQAGLAANQGPIANVTLTSHAPANAGSIGTIAVTLRSLVSSETRLVDGGVDCAPGATPDLGGTFAAGCAGPFRPAGAACTASSGTANGAATGPFDCLGGIAPGGLVALEGDYDNRWAPGGTCSANHWPALAPEDPRLVTLFLTEAIPDTQAPSDDYRITGFAAFYVTGWTGAPGDCTGVNDDPPGNDPPPSGSVWGHVVKTYVMPASAGIASATPCTLGSATLCIAALVK